VWLASEAVESKIEKGTGVASLEDSLEYVRDKERKP